MFSVLFPGQGSQSVGMAKNIYENFDYIRSLFKEADEILNVPITKIILDGPSEQLNKTENTQPAIFLVSFSIFKMIHNETSFNLKKAKFFAVILGMIIYSTSFGSFMYSVHRFP